MRPNPNKNPNLPSSEFVAVLSHYFGSFEGFQQEFSKTALNVFGSGWVFLVVDTASKQLRIVDSPNQGTTFFTQKMITLLALDVWEHVSCGESFW